MRRTFLTLLLSLAVALVLARPTTSLAAAGLASKLAGIGWPVVTLNASVTPTQVPIAGKVTYTVDLSNAGDVAASGVWVNFKLPPGFSYVWGSARIARDGILISSANPFVSGNTLTWDSLTVPARRGDSFYGINTMVQERCNIAYISWQLDHARYLMGYASWTKQLFYGITISSNDPPSCWIDYINAAYDRGLKPVIRLQGEHGGSFWHKPPANWPGNYTDIAQAFARVVSKLPRRDGHRLYIQIWNEPNLNLEWGGAANPTEYGQFLEQTAGAIRTITGGDSRIVILNAPLAPGGDIPPTTFMAEMFRTVPNSRWAFDIWAAHSYPGNYPPELNIHAGQAVRSDLTIDSYVSQIQTLAAWGRPYVSVLLSETGYLLNHQPDRRYPAISEALRADYISRAFQSYWRTWPELIGVAPYELSDPGVAWSGWNWVEDNNIRHAQYDAVLGLDKSYPYATSRLTISFQATAASVPGTYSSNIEAGATNTTIAGLYGVVPVTVYQLQPTSTPTRPPTATPTRTPTATPSPTHTPTPTATNTSTWTATSTATATPSPTSTSTRTPSPTPSHTSTVVPTKTLSPTATFTLQPSATSTATASATLSPTPSPTSTRTPTATFTPTPRPTPTLTSTSTPTATATPRPTNTSTPQPTFTATLTATPWPTGTATPQPSATATFTLPGKPDRYEPDDTPRDAGHLSADGSIQEHTFHRPGDVDWTRLEAISGVHYLIEVLAVSGVEPVVTLFGPDGQTPIDFGLGGSAEQSPQARGQGSVFRIIWQPPITETYLLRISEQQERGGSGYFYTLAATALPHGQYLPLVGGPARLVAAPAGPRLPGRAALPPGNLLTAVHALAVDPVSGHLYLLSDDTLTLYDPAGQRVLARASVGKGATALLLEDGQGSRQGARRVFVTSAGHAAVLALDAATLEVKGSAPGLRQPGGLAVANGRLFAADTAAGTVHWFALSDLRPLGTVEVGPGPYAMAALPSLGRVFVALTGSDGVAVLDSSSGTVLAVTALGGLGQPQGIVADEGAGVVYVVYALAPRYRQIAALDGVSGAVVDVIPATLDHPMTDSEALAVVGAAVGFSGRRLLVGSSQGIMIYDLARRSWAGLLPLAGHSPVPIFGLAVDGQRGVVYTAKADGWPAGWGASRLPSWP